MQRLRDVVDEHLRRAERWQEGDDPFPVVEALGYVVVLHLVDALSILGPTQRAMLLERARAVKDALSEGGGSVEGRGEGPPSEPSSRSAEDAEVVSWSLRVVALSSALLAGEDPTDALAHAPSELRPPTDRRVVRLLEGELDGLSAAACAVHLVRHGDARPALVWALEGERVALEAERESERPIRLAAAEPSALRPPDEGRLLGQHPELPLEAVLFAEDRQLALYASDPIFLQVKSEGVTPLEAQPGYWLGELDAPPEGSVTLEVHWGDRAWRWSLRFDV